MINDLVINGVDMHNIGVVMGEDFINALHTPITFKEDIENNSAIEHGIRLVLSPYMSQREITLTFNIHGSDSASFKANENAFLEILYGRKLTIKVVGDENYYRLVYSGTGVTYGRNHANTTCTIKAKFTEVNPADRAQTPLNSLFEV